MLYGPSLEVATDRTSQPLMRVRGMLTRNGTCLADRFWAWNGKSADFFDLAAGGGTPLRIQLSKGMNQLGLAIAEDLFLSSAPRKVRYKDSAIPGKDLPVMVEKPVDHQDLLGSWPSTVDPAIAVPCAPVVPRNTLKPLIDGGDAPGD